ncbi:hypothetical protein L1080_034230 [Rhodococcus sp. MSC1_016]|jgi:hypothetical protein|uniref:hypothetical protein n=1 Tax=Rhodococcus sp. MSC1_016 TaxID=2909266 RepID=UPI00202DC1CC|nr:hypothetical protein [Rhodococcus sp. MSC1_016]
MDTDHQAETVRRAGPQHTEHGYGTYEWDPQHGVVFRMDLDQFGTVGGVQISQYASSAFRGTGIAFLPIPIPHFRRIHPDTRNAPRG